MTSTVTVNAAGEGIFVLRGRPAADGYDFTDSIAAVVSAAERLRFHFIPADLYSDLRFLQSTGLANCQSAALHLCQVAAEHGLAARPAMGLFVSVPFSVRHVWLEIAADGAWRPADPFFLKTLAEWDVIGAQDCPLSRSPGFPLLRLAASALRDLPLILHNGDPAPLETSLFTAAAG